MKELSLREIQNESLNVFMDIDRVCRENRIKYCILFGTLIGAIRHKGFIPWDDDLDIGMPRYDYDRFLKCYKKYGKFRIVNYNTESNCPYMITRISNDQFRLKASYGPDYKIGVFVDVYPYDGIGSDSYSINKMVRKSKRNSRHLSRALEKNPFVAIKELHRGIKKWLLLLTYPIPQIMGPDIFRRELENLTHVNEYNSSEYVGCVIWALIKKECFPKKWIEELIEVEFEGRKVFAPKEYKEMLTQNYGDYMKIPPKSEQIGHHFYKIYRND